MMSCAGMMSLTVTVWWSLLLCATSSFCPPDFPCQCYENLGRSIQCTGLGLKTLPNFTNVSRDQSIRRIDLILNEIREIPDDAFSGLIVHKIILSVNNISTIADGAFRGLTNLSSLSLDECGLTSFPAVFTYTPTLETLELADNQIKKIEKHHFKHASNLKKLVLDRNPVVFTSDMFEYIEDTLEELQLESMQLEYIPVESIRNLHKLHKLDLRNNKLRAVGPIFQAEYTGRLSPYMRSEFDFSKNQITFVDPKAFANRPLISRLGLSHNAISNLTGFLSDYCIFQDSLIDVSHNPIHCDCDVYEVIKSQTLTLYGSCQTPKSLLDLSLGTTWDKRHFRKFGAEICGDQSLGMRYDCPCTMWRSNISFVRNMGRCGVQRHLTMMGTSSAEKPNQFNPILIGILVLLSSVCLSIHS